MDELLIKNGAVIAGAGTPGFAGKAAIHQGKIAAVNPYVTESAKRHHGEAVRRRYSELESSVDEESRPIPVILRFFVVRGVLYSNRAACV